MTCDICNCPFIIHPVFPSLGYIQMREFCFSGFNLLATFSQIGPFQLESQSCPLSPQTLKSCSWKVVEAVEIRENLIDKIEMRSGIELIMETRMKQPFGEQDKKTYLVTKLACRCGPSTQWEFYDLQPVDISRQTGSQLIVFKFAFQDWLTVPQAA